MNLHLPHSPSPTPHQNSSQSSWPALVPSFLQLVRLGLGFPLHLWLLLHLGCQEPPWHQLNQVFRLHLWRPPVHSSPEYHSLQLFPEHQMLLLHQ